MRLGLAQINTTVGDLAGNRRRIVDAYRDLVVRGAELVVFPELVTAATPLATSSSSAISSRMYRSP